MKPNLKKILSILFIVLSISAVIFLALRNQVAGLRVPLLAGLYGV